MKTNEFLDFSNTFNINFLNLDTFLYFLASQNLKFSEHAISVNEVLIVIDTTPIKCAAIFKCFDEPNESGSHTFIPKIIYMLDERFKKELASRYHQIKESNELIIQFLNSPNLLLTNNWLSNWPETVASEIFTERNEGIFSLDDFEKLSAEYQADYQFFEDLNYLFIRINNKLYFTSPLTLNNPFSTEELIYIELNQFTLVNDYQKHKIIDKIAEQDLISKQFYSSFKKFIAKKRS